MKIAAAGDFHSSERIEDFGRKIEEFDDLELVALLGDLFPKRKNFDGLNNFHGDVKRLDEIKQFKETVEAAIDLEKTIDTTYLIMPGNWDVKAKDLDEEVEEYVDSFEDPGVFRYREDLNLERGGTPHSLKLPEHDIYFVHGGFGDQTPYTDDPEHLDLNNNFFKGEGIIHESIDQNRRETGKGILLKGHDHEAALVHSTENSEKVISPEYGESYKVSTHSFYSIVPGRESIAILEESESGWELEFIEY